jgi:hypothetical protein
MLVGNYNNTSKISRKVMVAKMNAVVDWVKAHNKAIFGFLTSGVAMYLQVMDHGVTADEWWQVIGAALAGGGIVWVIPNLPKKPNPPVE